MRGLVPYDRKDVFSDKVSPILPRLLDHRPDFTAENAFQRSVNVWIELPCLVTLPVYSSMYSASFCCALCFGSEAGPSVFSFFVRTRRLLASVARRWKKPTHTLPSRRSIFLSHPSGASVRGRRRPRPLTSKSRGWPRGSVLV